MGPHESFPAEDNYYDVIFPICRDTVDGKNPAPVESGSLSHDLQGFFTSQVVQDFFHQQYDSQREGPLCARVISISTEAQQTSK